MQAKKPVNFQPRKDCLTQEEDQVLRYLDDKYGETAALIWWIAYLVQIYDTMPTGETARANTYLTSMQKMREPGAPFRWWVTTMKEMIELGGPFKNLKLWQLQYAVRILQRDGLLKVERASYENRMQGWYRALPESPHLLAHWQAKTASNAQKGA